MKGINIEDNSKIYFFLFLNKKTCYDPLFEPSQRLNETVLMMGHKMFYGEMCLIIISELPLLPLLIWSTNSQNYPQKSTLLSQFLG